MECTRWAEEGLLYLSGELEGEKTDRFEKHVAACEFCRDEVEAYRREKATLFALQLLQEPTSPRLDERIKAACTKLPQPTLGFALLASYVKKGVLPVLFLLVGFGGGVYVAFHIERAEREVAPMADEGDAAETVAPVVAPTVKPSETAAEALARARQGSPAVADDDSARADSASSRTPSFDSEHLGSMDAQGVVPVDLQDR